MGRATQLAGWCLGVFLMVASPALAQEISGRWNVVVELDAGGGAPTFIFEQSGGTLTGAYEGTFDNAEVTGTVDGNQVEFWFDLQGVRVTYTGTIDGDTMAGTCDYAGVGSGEWEAQRAES